MPEHRPASKADKETTKRREEAERTRRGHEQILARDADAFGLRLARDKQTAAQASEYRTWLRQARIAEAEKQAAHEAELRRIQSPPTPQQKPPDAASAGARDWDAETAAALADEHQTPDEGRAPLVWKSPTISGPQRAEIGGQSVGVPEEARVLPMPGRAAAYVLIGDELHALAIREGQLTEVEIPAELVERVRAMYFGTSL